MEDKLLPGTVFSTHFAPVDGVLLEKQFTGNANWNEPGMHNKLIHLVATHDFTNYRRFRTTVTIRPTEADPQ